LPNKGRAVGLWEDPYRGRAVRKNEKLMEKKLGVRWEGEWGWEKGGIRKGVSWERSTRLIKKILGGRKEQFESLHKGEEAFFRRRRIQTTSRKGKKTSRTPTPRGFQARATLSQLTNTDGKGKKKERNKGTGKRKIRHKERNR